MAIEKRCQKGPTVNQNLVYYQAIRDQLNSLEQRIMINTWNPNVHSSFDRRRTRQVAANKEPVATKKTKISDIL